MANKSRIHTFTDLSKFERNDSSVYSGDDFYVNPTEVQTVS